MSPMERIDAKLLFLGVWVTIIFWYKVVKMYHFLKIGQSRDSNFKGSGVIMLPYSCISEWKGQTLNCYFLGVWVTIIFWYNVVTMYHFLKIGQSRESNFKGVGLIFPYICVKHGYWYGSKNPLTSCLIHISQRSHTCRVGEQNQFCVMIWSC